MRIEIRQYPFLDTGSGLLTDQFLGNVCAELKTEVVLGHVCAPRDIEEPR
jgi:hypothetical protein